MQYLWMTYGELTNEVGYITDIPWLLEIYRSKTTPSPWAVPSGSGWFSMINPCNHSIHNSLCTLLNIYVSLCCRRLKYTRECSPLWGEHEGVVWFVWCIIVFHSTTLSHLYTSHITIVSFPGHSQISENGLGMRLLVSPVSSLALSQNRSLSCCCVIC